MAMWFRQRDSLHCINKMNMTLICWTNKMNTLTLICWTNRFQDELNISSHKITFFFKSL